MLHRLNSHSRRRLLVIAIALLSIGGASADEPAAELEAPVLIQPADLPEPRRYNGAAAPEASVVTPGSLGSDELAPLDEASIQQLGAAVRASHPWARFSPGAWRRVRVTSQSFAEDGSVASASTAERTERLVAVGEETYTLETENQLPVAGQTAAAPTLSRKLWLLTDHATDSGRPKAVSHAPASISLGATVASCDAWILVTKNAGATEELTLSLAEGVVPTLLRRESAATQGDGPGPRLVQSVSRTDLPTLYQGKMVTSWRLTTTLESPDGARTIGDAVASLEVPGGIHTETTTEYAPDGRRLRWVVTELVDSGLDPQEVGAPDSESSTAAPSPPPPAVSIEVRPRKFLRILRREQREADPGI